MTFPIPTPSTGTTLSTATFGVPVANGLNYIQQLVESGWTAWTPLVTGTTTTPTLGPGGGVIGAYKQVGSLVVAEWAIIFGTSGVSPGAGFYQIGTPPPPILTTNYPIGTGLIARSSPRGFWPILVIPVSTSTCRFAGYAAATDYVTSSLPITWAVNDRIIGSMSYRAS